MTPPRSQPENLNDFDQAARYAIRHLDPIGFFRWLLGRKFLRVWKFSQWVDTQAVPFPGGADLRCDTVAGFTRIDQLGPPVAFVVEFMSRTRTPTLLRLQRYALIVKEDCPAQLDPLVQFTVLGGLINLTGGQQRPTLREQAPGTGKLGLRARFKVRPLAKASADKLLQAIETARLNRSLVVWLPLMVGGDSVDVVRRVRAIVEGETNRSLRGDIVGIALVLAELVERRAIWKEILGDLDVERSVTVMEWEARGEARGETRGRLLSTRELLIQALRTRFAAEVSDALVQFIQKEEALPTLTAWFNAAVAARPDESLADLGRQLGWPV